uniref:RusA family crossover junction endodeoxyribonuclease n=1 Tax=Rhodanobacter glycinis TaxID=582702 RepID=UPI00209C45F4|nr:RusA family crossover junction endodeoxyribonuclease [Rhodanobacter glycinis]
MSAPENRAEQVPTHIARAPEDVATHGELPSYGLVASSAATERTGSHSGIRLVLPPPISANRYWRSFVPRGGSRAITCVSDEARAYKRDALKLALAAGVRSPIRGRVALDVQLYPARPLDWAKRSRKDPDGWADSVRCIDLDNVLKVLLDALKGVAFGDDSWVRSLHAQRMEPDEHGARVVVTISPLVRERVAPELPL